MALGKEIERERSGYRVVCLTSYAELDLATRSYVARREELGIFNVIALILHSYKQFLAVHGKEERGVFQKGD
jgi:hypothetical protein